MSRRGRSRSDPVDGLILLDKPAGLTSNQALQKVRRLLRARKAGHAGSLDPAATGMLPICLGEATKVCPYLLDADKTYRVTARLGVATDTGDADGEEVARAEVPQMSRQEWAAALQAFVGESMQVPPMYSALKHGGRRLYELARRGESVERQPRPIRIDAIELLEVAGHRLVFRVRCSKGTYIRTLVEDLAATVGTVAHTARLHRESVGGFPAAEMLDMSTIESAATEDLQGLRKRMLAPDVALRSLPAVTLGSDAGRRFVAGQALPQAGTDTVGLVRVYAEAGRFLGVGKVSPGGELAPQRVFRLEEKKP